MAHTALREIELETVNEIAPASVLRQEYRIPAEEMGNIVVDIYSSEFNAVNMSLSGVGIDIDSAILFSIGESLGKLTLRIGADEFTFHGLVAHVTARENKGFHCGIALTSLMDHEGTLEFEKALSKLRKKTFAITYQTY